MKRVVRGVCEDGPLLEEQETEGQRQLHSLLLQQLNTEANIDRCVAKKKCFAPAALYKPFGEQAVGVRSLAQFRQLQDGERELDSLRELGLTNTEIELWRSRELPENSRKRHGVCAAPEAMDERLQVIRDKMAARAELLARPQRFADSRALTRREMEIEKALFHGNDRCSFLTALYHQAAALGLPRLLFSSTSPEDNSQNGQQGQKSSNSMDSLYRNLLTDKHKNSKGIVTSMDSLLPCIADLSQTSSKNKPLTLSNTDGGHCGPETSEPIMAKGQKQEVDQEKPSRPEPPQKVTVNLPIGRLSGSSGGSKCGPVMVSGKVEQITNDEIRTNRETEEAIRRIPRFQNYQCGEPSHVLCVKNISPRTSLPQLVSLFSRFQKDDSKPILYRLLTGRLKGQAFITFADRQTAQAALDMVHGYKLLDRPLVIEFSREKSNSKSQNISEGSTAATLNP